MIKELMMKILNKRTTRIGLLILIVGFTISTVQLSFTLGQENEEETSIFEGNSNLGFMAAAMAIGISALGGGIAIYGATSAGAAAIAERPETFVYILIFAGLGEGLAIYGLVVAIMILGKI
jgi:V/A-type H+-transporting ATPase subunit K